MNTKKGRRKGFQSLLVEPYKQVKLGLLFLILNFVFAFAIVGVFGYYIWDIYQTISAYFALSQQESILTLQKFMWPFSIGTGLIVIFILATLYVSIRYTHEIYGPLVSIHRYLDDILEGKKPTPLQLRESDQLQDLANKLNLISDKIMKKKE